MPSIIPPRRHGRGNGEWQAYSTQELKARATGAWLEILGALAPSLSPAIAKIGKHVPCPIHGGKDGFRLLSDAPNTGGGICNTCGYFSDGLALLMWANGWKFQAALREVARYLGMTSDAPTQAPRELHQSRVSSNVYKKDEKKRERLNTVGAGLLPGTDPQALPMRRYLASRNLGSLPIPDSLQFHPALPYFHDGRLLGTCPAMVALVSGPDGTLVTLHRTYLTPDGQKLTIEGPEGDRLDPRKLMSPVTQGSTRGGAIRLFEPKEGLLAVAEGVETALAYHVLFGLPAWSCINAGLLAAVEIPLEVRRLVIAVDRDLAGAGQSAGLALGERLQADGFRVVRHDELLALPEDSKAFAFALPPNLCPGGNTDWNDILMTKGSADDEA